MKAPIKIYIREFAEGLNQMWSSIRATETSATAQHKYIRKDALIEWAKANLQDRDNWIEKSAADAFWEMIDKLNSM